jgi:hypothetical protein
MIIWIASYPKSGNTWLRLLISNYLWPNSSNLFDNLNHIQRFPHKKFFEGIVGEEILKKDNLDIFKYFIIAQQKINNNNKLNILKTHNFAGSIKNYPFTNSKNSSGAIYIVRDPRSVVVSSAYHNDYEFEKSTERIMSTKNVSLNDGFMEARLTWKIHYLSWKKLDIPKIIIKYEDLFSDPSNKFLEVLEFINQFKKIKISENKIKETIEKCSFENLADNEKKFGFTERLGKENFFRKGLVDEWKKVLKKDLVKKIEKEFFEEMKELKYL